MKKNKFSLYFIIISFFSLITVFIFLVQKSYFNLLKPQKEVENNALLKEINPDLDLSIISEIESRDKNSQDNFDYSILDPKAEPSLEPTPITTPVEEQTSTLDESNPDLLDQVNMDETLDESNP